MQGFSLIPGLTCLPSTAYRLLPTVYCLLPTATAFLDSGLGLRLPRSPLQNAHGRIGAGGATLICVPDGEALTFSLFAVTVHMLLFVVNSGIFMVDWLTIEDLASYLKKPKSTLYKLVVARRLRGYKVGRSWRFDREEVDSWVKSHKPRPTKRAKR